MTKSKEEIRRNFIASASTGSITMLCSNWLDCLKARWQVQTTDNDKSLFRFLKRIVKNEGLWNGLWKHALGTNMAACTCSMGARIGLYPFFRDTMGAKDGFKMVAAGLASGMIGYWTASPLFMIKTRIQSCAGESVPYKTGLHGLLNIIRNEGVKGLWNGSFTFMMRGATLSGTQLASYDSTKTSLISNGYQDGPLVHISASTVSAVCLTTSVMPLDSTLTTFQSSRLRGTQSFSSPFHAARHLYCTHGPSVFMRGWTAMFTRMLPTSIGTFFIYEKVRKFLGLNYLN